jgi:HAD superfamily hydrolase (TIGR01509 family)
MHPLLQGKTVLFDVDGTIAETEGDGHLPAFNQAFDEPGLPWSWTPEEYGSLLAITGGFERIMAYAKSVGAASSHAPSFEDRMRQIHRRKNQIYADRLQAGLIKPRQGLLDLLRALGLAGQDWAVVTTTSRANWQALWLSGLVPALKIPAPVIAICGEDVAKKKPHPEAYQQALARLGLKAHQAVAIEDSENGVAAAVRAGLSVVVVKSLFFQDQAFPDARLVVSELTELLG